MTKFVLIALFIFASLANGGTATSVSNITNVFVYGDGRILVNGFTFGGASCSNNGSFWIAGDHPKINTLLALVLSAQASGRKLSVTAQIDGGCWYPEVTQSSSTYMYTVD